MSSVTVSTGDLLFQLICYCLFASSRERHKREKSEEKIDCHHQDSNQGPSLVATDALTTELWCSRQHVLQTS